MKTIVQLEHVSKHFGRKVLFQDLNLDLPAAQLIGITGPSGAGKTTLLNLLSGIEKADQGTIESCGVNLSQWTAAQKMHFYRSRIAFLFQNFGLVEYETVRHNLEIALRYVRQSKAEKEKAMQLALEKVGLPGFLDRKIYELSGGEQQRVALARV